MSEHTALENAESHFHQQVTSITRNRVLPPIVRPNQDGGAAHRVWPQMRWRVPGRVALSSRGQGRARTADSGECLYSVNREIDEYKSAGCGGEGGRVTSHL